MAMSERVVEEFSSFYQADELPPFDSQWRTDTLPEWAEASADRLAGGLSDADRKGMIDVLRAAAADPNHPLVAELARVTTVAWRHPRAWPELVLLLDAIAAHLEA